MVHMFAANTATGYVLLALQLVAMAGAVFAIVHALRQRTDAFPAAGKLTKPMWLGILVVALLILFAFGFSGFFGIIGVVAVGVYLVDVRPKVEEVQRGSGNRW
ncbi:hypothetical protein GCM10007304_06750 [Rhodococcoides trifolii]|uniref:DUF2516 family protein n=2 Tax=Rhodococcoides trifolii TaxID=908250 RepID=A0A917CSK9_9NOCA|nr:hypothetical protein GCM10007304_06750 [Rhodococcus trifolii]